MLGHVLRFLCSKRVTATMAMLQSITQHWPSLFLRRSLHSVHPERVDYRPLTHAPTLPLVNSCFSLYAGHGNIVGDVRDSEEITGQLTIYFWRNKNIFETRVPAAGYRRVPRLCAVCGSSAVGCVTRSAPRTRTRGQISPPHEDGAPHCGVCFLGYASGGSMV